MEKEMKDLFIEGVPEPQLRGTRPPAQSASRHDRPRAALRLTARQLVALLVAAELAPDTLSA
jgi:hypothetical protein